MAMVFIFLAFVLILISGFAILFNLGTTGSLLSDVGRELEELAQNLDQQSPEEGDAIILGHLPEPRPNWDELADSPDDNDTQKPVTASPESGGLKRNVLTKMMDYLVARKSGTAVGRKNEEFASSLISDSDLKRRILAEISRTEESISLQYLVKRLSRRHFDGNYHPVLNELDQLEREGEIEGQVVNGKVVFKKRQKETRKYILRKGKNFQKYMG